MKNRGEKKLKLIDRCESQLQGEIVVGENNRGRWLLVEGVVQSGVSVEELWKPVVESLFLDDDQYSKVLILGLGGGSVVKLLRKHQGSLIFKGVEVDGSMIKLARKYFEQNLDGVELVCADAIEYCGEAREMGEKFDLVLVDVFVGKKSVDGLVGREVLKQLSLIVDRGGKLVINLSAWPESMESNKVVIKLMHEIFGNVRPLISQMNLFLISRK